MKILRVLLWIFGVANIPVGIITMANAPAESVNWYWALLFVVVRSIARNV